MNSLSKLFSVLVLFTFLFFGLRFYGQYFGYNVEALISDLGGLTYLYSTVGMMFAIFAAFVIVSESQDWSTLSTASKDELRNLNEILRWSRGLSATLSSRISHAIQAYLEAVINKEWTAIKNGSESPEAELLVSDFHELLMLASKENPEIGSHMFALFNEFLNHRAIRIEYSYQPLPRILKFTVYLVDASVIGLSLFIGVKNLWLDFIFMTCLVTLGTVILLVVEDLDNPLHPGEWCLTSKDFAKMLEVICHS